MQLLHRHSIIDKPLRQVLQQFRIGGALAHNAEIAGCIHDSGTKVRAPDAIDNHAHRNRLLDNLFRQIQAAASVIQRDRIAAQHRKEMPRNFVSQIERTSA